MKILICDYAGDLARDLDYEKALLRAALPEAEIAVYRHEDHKAALLRAVRDADAAMTTYVDFDREVLEGAEKLKCVVLNAVGYNMVDVAAATERGVLVCPAAEYCTTEVAEHTLALLFALSRGLRKYVTDVERHVWNYMGAGKLERISGKTAAIFGFGRIGRAVAEKFQALGLRVLAVSGSLTADEAKALGVEKADWQTAMERADILSNHMALKPETRGFFNLEKFERAKKRPLFLNTGRGDSVVEDDLAAALDRGLLRGAGLDVLAGENVDFGRLRLLGRDNVIITPHAGFYSVQAARDLQDISCGSLIGVLTGRLDRVSKIVNRADLGI